MAKKQETKKVEVKVAPEVKSVLTLIANAAQSLQDAVAMVNKIVGCPENIVNRLSSLSGAIVRTGQNAEKRLTNLEAKAARAEATAARKIVHLEKMKAQAAKLAKRIADAEKK